MPALVTVRPLASSAGKAGKGGPKNAAARADDSRRGQGQGRMASPTIAPRARVESLHRAAAAQAQRQSQQQCLLAPPPAQQKQPLRSNLHSQLSSAAKHLQDQQSGVAPLPQQVEEKQRTTSEKLLRGNGPTAAVVAAQRMGTALDYSSSGSEHEPNSFCLAEMVYDYILEEENSEAVTKCGRARCNCDSSSCGGDESSRLTDAADAGSLGGEIGEVLKGLIPCVSSFEKNVYALVTSTLKKLEDAAQDAPESGQFTGYSSEEGQVVKGVGNENQSATCKAPSKRRLVMSALRSGGGYNAAICKSRWDHGGGFPAGEYEYIDVIISNNSSGVLISRGSSDRILIDIDFRTQFEIARQTSQYTALLQLLPTVFVGKASRLQQIVNIMCDASKRCLKKTGMHLPPWRKPEYIRAKWFSTYRRTTNNEASLPSAASRAFRGTQFGKSLAMGGGDGWDSNFTNEMEKSFQMQAADFRKALRVRDLTQQAELDQTIGLEGKVRGANRLGLLLQEDSGIDTELAAAYAATAAEWEPPVLMPRPAHRGALTSILTMQQRQAFDANTHQ